MSTIQTETASSAQRENPLRAIGVDFLKLWVKQTHDYFRHGRHPVHLRTLLRLSRELQQRTSDGSHFTAALTLAEDYAKQTGDESCLSLAAQLRSGACDTVQSAPKPPRSEEPTIASDEDHADVEDDEDEDKEDDEAAKEAVTTPAQTQAPVEHGASRLGRAIVAIAEKHLALREDAGTNQDTGGKIRNFFLEGLKWPASTWDNWAQKFPKSGTNKPEWCAAFAGYCVRKGYEQLGLELPVRLVGTASESARSFSKAGRFVRREELFDASSGRINPSARRPGPGDMVVWNCHVGLLKELHEDGCFVTLEGNTWRGSVRKDGVYQCNRKSTEKNGKGEYKLLGFCLVANTDHANQD